MKNSCLIQRLEKPREGSNPFSFGGGYKDGGLSENAMDLIRPIFSFDYMGAAEFEFGALPEALQKMAKNAANLVSGKLTATTKGGNSAKVFYIGQKDHVVEIEKRILTKAHSEYGDNNFSCKEWVGLQRVIDKEKYADHIGWLELDNGYFFFVDKNAWEKTCALFKVKI